MYQYLTHGEVLKPIATRVEAMIAPLHKQVDERIEENQFRVLKSFQAHRVSDSHFIPTTGYGYDDIGRDTLGIDLCRCFWGGSRTWYDHKLFQERMPFLLLYLEFFVQEMNYYTLRENPMILLKKLLGFEEMAYGSLRNFKLTMILFH